MSSTTADSNSIKCIFCLEMKPSSDEHVMPKTLGGNLILRCVCETCNNGLSHLDQSLSDNSLLILPRLVQQPDATWGQSAHLATEELNGKNLEIKVGHKLQPEMKAQLIFTPKSIKGEYQLRGSSESSEGYEEFFKVLRKQIAKKGTTSIPILSPVDKSESSEPGFRLVLNRSSQVVFRASSEDANADEEFAAMVDLLDSKLESIEKSLIEAAKMAPVKRIDQPGVIFNMSFDFGKNLRAVSKIAYTFLAKTYGCEFVSGPNFDSLRQYILTGAGADDQGCLWWNGDEKEKSLGSTRYATWLKDHNDQVYSFGRPEAHVVSVCEQVDRHVVMLEFYGQFSFAVDVGNIGVPLQIPHVHEFDFTNRTNTIVPAQEVIRRFADKLSKFEK